jgi:hypothetical protein
MLTISIATGVSLRTKDGRYREPLTVQRLLISCKLRFTNSIVSFLMLAGRSGDVAGVITGEDRKNNNAADKTSSASR